MASNREARSWSAGLSLIRDGHGAILGVHRPDNKPRSRGFPRSGNRPAVDGGFGRGDDPNVEPGSPGFAPFRLSLVPPWLKPHTRTPVNGGRNQFRLVPRNPASTPGLHRFAASP